MNRLAFSTGCLTSVSSAFMMASAADDAATVAGGSPVANSRLRALLSRIRGSLPAGHRRILHNCPRPWRACPFARRPRARTDSQSVGMVGHQPGIVRSRDLSQLGDRTDVPLHAEDGFSQDQTPLETGPVLAEHRLALLDCCERSASPSHQRAGCRPTCTRARAGRPGSGHFCRPAPGSCRYSPDNRCRKRGPLGPLELGELIFRAA